MGVCLGVENVQRSTFNVQLWTGGHDAEAEQQALTDALAGEDEADVLVGDAEVFGGGAVGPAARPEARFQGIVPPGRNFPAGFHRSFIDGGHFRFSLFTGEQ
jgi:hypothetical protein